MVACHITTDNTSGDRSQQATNAMSQSMELLSQMGMGWLSAFTNDSGLFKYSHVGFLYSFTSIAIISLNKIMH